MYILIFALGIIIGSFLNVCIYRIPREESIAFPPSRCTRCSHPLAWHDLIPILSYLSLKGKCRYCGEAISPQYPVIEALNGILYLFVFHYFGLSLEFVFYGFMLSILIVICLIDYYDRIIPDGLVLTILTATVLYKAAVYFAYGTPVPFRDGIYGFLSGGLLFLAIAVISNGAMGGGDIKLTAALGLILGLKKTILNILLSFMIGAAVSLYLLLSGRKGRKDEIPFGPFINISFVITLFFGDGIIRWYVQSFIG
jgi:leader peptidase (prepilin peptidase)/N-methyltransferase